MTTPNFIPPLVATQCPDRSALIAAASSRRQVTFRIGSRCHLSGIPNQLEWFFYLGWFLRFRLDDPSSDAAIRYKEWDGFYYGWTGPDFDRHATLCQGNHPALLPYHLFANGIYLDDGGMDVLDWVQVNNERKKFAPLWRAIHLCLEDKSWIGSVTQFLDWLMKHEKKTPWYETIWFMIKDVPRLQVAMSECTLYRLLAFTALNSERLEPITNRSKWNCSTDDKVPVPNGLDKANDWLAVAKLYRTKLLTPMCY